MACLFSRLSVVFAFIFILGCGNTASDNQVGSSEEAEAGQAQSADNLEFISPSQEPINIGNAGEVPANIARYLLASGAGSTMLSPDGQTLAFVYSVTGRPQLWALSLNSERAQARQLTFGNGVTFFHWAPNSQYLIYGADNNGNEQESFYSISLDGESEKLILPAVEGGFRVFGEFNQDGSLFAYASTERNGLDFDIYLSNSKTGESRLVYRGKYGFSVEAFSPDAKTLVLGETVGEDSDNLYLFDIEKNTLDVISKPEPRANHTDAGVVWGEDNALYFATNKDREYAALIRYDLKQKTYTTLFEEDADVEQLNLCGERQKYLVWATNRDGFSQLHAMVRDTGEMLETPELKEGVYQLSCASNANVLAIRINGWATPGDIDIWDIEQDRHSSVFASNLAGLSRSRLVRPESVRIQARDAVLLQGLLYLPDEGSKSSQGLPPVVFSVHGGPTAQSRPSFKPHIQYYVDHGIAVFETNVRGSTGFGRTYTTLDDKEKRLDSVRDLIDMLDFLGQDGRVDTERAAVMGGSYGGYMVNAVLARYPGSFRAGVSLFGVADWVTALEVASPGLKASDLVEYGDINDPYWREFYTLNSPIRQADRINVPVLYSHGVMDPRVDIAETETMVRALGKNGVEASFIKMTDEGHGWRKLSNRLFYYRREVEFLEKYLIGADPVF